jgi:hypothetical protein
MKNKQKATKSAIPITHPPRGQLSKQSVLAELDLIQRDRRARSRTELGGFANVSSCKSALPWFAKRFERARAGEKEHD